MSKKKIMLRVQSSEGTRRVECDPQDSTMDLFQKVHDAFGLSAFCFALYRERGNKDEINSSRSKTVKSLGLNHGDLIYLAPINGAVLWPTDSSSNSLASVTPSGESGEQERSLPSTSSSQTTATRWKNSSSSSGSSSNGSQEDEVDLQLWKMDGKIKRDRDDKLCRHGANACCLHCSPLEPFDEAYLKEQKIKHMSFHSYLRKLTAGVDRGKFVALEDISCRIKLGCKDHPPWPRGICSKCQPNAVTLNRQIYRHVDNVMFENPQIVERFLDYWRVTGHQRIGFLYGTYEIHGDVPLGTRATVSAIYEPPQESSRDSVTLLLPDDKEDLVDDVARQLGMRRIGWIFTDLIADDMQKGTVQHVRNIESHFLSAQECIMAGHFQNLHPNPCRFSPGGYFGSKFATVCVTGDSTNQVHMEGYQVSNQCMALVRDGCLVPTKDAPELGSIRESSDKQYVPDVYYKEKDNYGNEVPRLARPLPVEYLLVDVPASTPLVPQYKFHFDPSISQFPVENRMVQGHLQDFGTLSNYMRQFTDDQFLMAMSDFHVLLYIATMDMLPLREHMGPLLEAVKSRNFTKASEWRHSEQWGTVEQLIAATEVPSASGSHLHDVHGASGSGLGGGAKWTCPHCTFINASHLSSCEMCNLPR